jgi:tRNA nucleotidyltransferase (CCA-adding enzyme)
MKIIVGHSNMDLDSIGSMVLARCLFPDHRLVASRQIHPVARHLDNLYRERLDCLPAAQLSGQRVERMVVVDTRQRRRIEEYLQPLGQLPDDILVFDHHTDDACDIPGAVVREKAVGANTTLLGMELLRRSVSLHPDDATMALTGIYADTGNFTHENVEYSDFQVASLCLQHGASLPLVRQFLRPLAESRQLALFHEILNGLSARGYGGHRVQLCLLELERQSAGLAAVVEQVFEVEGPDALFVVFSFPAEKQSLLIARSRSRDIDLLAALAAFGAAGHALAASAQLKGRWGPEVLEELDRHLSQVLRPAPTAARLMRRDYPTLREEMSLLEATVELEKAGWTGAPVAGPGGELAGFLSLRDIMKGRRSGQLKAPVRAYMTRNLVSASPQTPMREIGELFLRRPVGQVPLVDSGRLVGLVSLADYLGYLEERRRQDAEFLQRLREKSAPPGGGS